MLDQYPTKGHHQAAHSTIATRMAASTSSTKTSNNVVIRCGHVIPQIRLTPPDNRPAKSPEVPEQDLGSNRLYVPLRTEEIGWEEGGLIWAPKRFYYPTVNLYGGDDDHIIGQYRGGPKGYRFIKITDSNFALANSDEDQIEASSAAGSSRGSSKKSKSTMPRGPVKMTVSTPKKEEEEEKANAEEVSMADSISFDDTMSHSISSSASSSRQGSFSTEDGLSSGANTGATTPDTTDLPTQGEEKGVFAERLNDALDTALKVQNEKGTNENGRQTRRLASRAGACEIPSDPIDASRLAGPLKVQLESNPLGHDRSMVLSNSVPEKHFSSHRGRSMSRLSISDCIDQFIDGQNITNDYAAGWTYEQNMQSQMTHQDSIKIQIDSDMIEQDSR